MGLENVPQKQKTEYVPALPINDFVRLPHAEQIELASHTYEHFQNELEHHGFSEFTDISDMYRMLPNETLIVRRENPEALDTLFSKGNYEITFVGDSEYANCVEWKPSNGSINLQNTYIEGFSQKNSVVVVVGIKPNEQLKLTKLQDSQDDFYGLDRRGVRSTHGIVTGQDLVFVSLRIPIMLMDETKLTEDEIERKFEYIEEQKSGTKPHPIFIHRGFARSTQIQ